MAITLANLLDQIEIRQAVLNKDQLKAHLAQQISGINNLANATADQISFLADNRHKNALMHTQAGMTLITPENQKDVPDHSLAILVKSPYLAYASISQLFEANRLPSDPSDSPTPQIHPTAQIASTAQIAQGVKIGAFCIIGENVQIGQNTQINSHVAIKDHAKIGEHCLIDTHAMVGSACQIGDHVRIHAHASIGSDGFGFAPIFQSQSPQWERIAQLGKVIIGNHVRIGTQTCIDRGAIHDTIIEDDVIIDNLVQIAHNVHIGQGTAIAAKTGIAGSTKIGKHCMIGGAVGIGGHLHITDNVTLTGMAMVTKSIQEAGIYSSGIPAMPSKKWRKTIIDLRNLNKESKKE